MGYNILIIFADENFKRFQFEFSEQNLVCLYVPLQKWD